MYCQNCRKEIPDDSRYCPECGAKLDTEPANDVLRLGAVPQSGSNGKECQKCGMEIPADSRCCPECGAAQKVWAGNQARREMTPPNPETIKRNKIIFASVTGLVAFFLLIAIVSSFIKPSINLNKYVMIKFEGYDTVGTAEAIFDYDKFESDFGKEMGASNKKNAFSGGIPFSKHSSKDFYGSNDNGVVMREFLSNCVSWSLSEDNGLSNGRVVTLAWQCDDDYALKNYGYKLKYADTEYTVNDLKEAEVFDPFTGIEVVFDGISSKGAASIEGIPSKKEAEGLNYSLDVHNGLKNGDEVTVTVSAYGDDPVSYCINNYGKIPSPLEKTYVVDGLNSYVFSIAEISEESYGAMKAQAEDVYHAEVANNWGEDESLENSLYLGSYLLTMKDSNARSGSENVLYLVYRMKVRDNYTNSNGDSYDNVNDIYWYISYDNLLVNPSGANTVDLTNFHTPRDRFTIDSGINSGWWSSKSWYYYGYESLDLLYKTVVTANAEYYNHEDDIDEALAPVVEVPEGLAQAEAADQTVQIFPNSSEELLTESDIESLSEEELRFATNEIYARIGYIFKDDQLRSYYEQFDWYEGTVMADAFSTNLFNEVEKKNVELLQKFRDN